MRNILLFSCTCLAASSALAGGLPRHGQLTNNGQSGNTVAKTIDIFASAPNGGEISGVKSPTVLAGKVTLPGGLPAANARLYLAWQSGQRQTQLSKFSADAAGSFRIGVNVARDLYTGEFGITAYVPGSGFVWQSQQWSSKALDKINLQLKPLRNIQGRLVYPDGRPAGHIEVGATHVWRPFQSNQAFPMSRNSEMNDFQLSQVLNSVHINLSALPDEDAKSLPKSRTDEGGKFILRDVPTDCAVSLEIGSALTLTSAGRVPFEVTAGGAGNLGLLVASRQRTLRVRVLDDVTGYPVPAASVAVFRQGPADNLLPMQAGSTTSYFSGQAGYSGGLDQGEVTVPGLLPGTYVVSANMQSATINVLPDGPDPILAMRVRSRILKGRLLDASGNPLAKYPVAVNFPFDRGLLGFEHGPRISQSNTGGSDSLLTNADGKFELSYFPWSAKAVTVRAENGDALAEWTGAPTQIGRELILKMKPHALMTVTGRLIDPERHAVRQMTCEALHWLPSPRVSWFTTAQPVVVDAAGRFRVSGLERGGTFSIITDSSLNQIAQTRPASTPAVILPRRLSFAGAPIEIAVSEPTHDFESPRFVTRIDTDEQEIGDVTVHPVRNSAEIQHAYGGSNSSTFKHFDGFIQTPSPLAIQQARDALLRYESALEIGDVDAIFKLSSKLSFGWSSERSEFLMHGWLRPPLYAGGSPTRALPFVMPFSVAGIIALNSGVPPGDSEALSTAENEIANHPDWVFFARNAGKRIEPAGIFHKEDGQWRVVTVPDLAHIDIASGVLIGADEKAAGFDVIPAPLSAAERETAIQFGQESMKNWASKGMSAIWASKTADGAAPIPDDELTLAFHADRLDNGLCPIRTDEAITLSPLNGVTAWDLAELNNVAQTLLHPVHTGRISQFAFEPTPKTSTLPEIVALGYTNAGEKRFLMLLAKNKSGWKMIEPALPY